MKMKQRAEKPHLTSVATAVATVIGAGVLSVGQVSANPFQVTELTSGYMQLAEGSCGEGKCGATKSENEGSCGEKKAAEGSCGEKKKAAEGSCGGKKEGEGSCGGSKDAEGKCGGAA